MKFASKEEIREYVTSLEEESLISQLSVYQHVVTNAKRKTLENQLIEHLETEYFGEEEDKEDPNLLHFEENDEDEEEDEDHHGEFTSEPILPLKQGRGNRSLTPADKDSERAYRRLMKFFALLELHSEQEQNEFLQKAQHWQQNKKKRRRYTKANEKLITRISEDPTLAEAAFMEITQKYPEVLKKFTT